MYDFLFKVSIKKHTQVQTILTISSSRAKVMQKYCQKSVQVVPGEVEISPSCSL